MGKAEQELKAIKETPLLPIYTFGGHGYEDDDDEDFWCPICHEHIGTHWGIFGKCPLCGQLIDRQWDKVISYNQMCNSEVNKSRKELIK